MRRYTRLQRESFGSSVDLAKALAKFRFRLANDTVCNTIACVLDLTALAHSSTILYLLYCSFQRYQ